MRVYRNLTSLVALSFLIASAAHATPRMSPTDPNPKRYDAAKAAALEALEAEGPRGSLSAESPAAVIVPTDSNPKRYDAAKAAAVVATEKDSPRGSLGTHELSRDAKKVPTDTNPKRYDALKNSISR